VLSKAATPQVCDPECDPLIHFLGFRKCGIGAFNCYASLHVDLRCSGAQNGGNEIVASRRRFRVVRVRRTKAMRYRTYELLMLLAGLTAGSLTFVDCGVAPGPK
jgi:hypothetical protein